MRRVGILCLITSVLAFSVAGQAQSELKKTSVEMSQAFHAMDTDFKLGAVPERVSDLKYLFRDGVIWNCKNFLKKEIIESAAGENPERLLDRENIQVKGELMLKFTYDEASRQLKITDVNDLTNPFVRFFSSSEDFSLAKTFDFDNSQVLDGMPSSLSNIKEGKATVKGQMMTFGQGGASFVIKSIHIRPSKKHKNKNKNGGVINEHDTELIQCVVRLES